MIRVNVILLTWKRLSSLSTTLKLLNRQSFLDFTLYVSNGNLEEAERVDRHVNKYVSNFKVLVRHDGNEHLAFRRFLLAKEIANKSDIIIFLDDDVTFSANFVRSCVEQYERGTYKSAYCWKFLPNATDYYRDRSKVNKPSDVIHYAGTGAAVIDPQIFLDDRFWLIPEKGKQIEDLWLSYFTSHVLQKKIGMLKLDDIHFGGYDSHALNAKVSASSYDKTKFLNDLILMGWKI